MSPPHHRQHRPDQPDQPDQPDGPDGPDGPDQSAENNSSGRSGQHDKRIACLWFPQWPVQRLVAAEPELRQRHLVLFRIDSRQGKRVAAASPLARQAGVRIDMPLTEARSLLIRAAERFGNPTAGARDRSAPPNRRNNHSAPTPAGPPDSTSPVHPRESQNDCATQFYVLQHDPAADHRALKQLAETLEKFSPVIGIEQDLGQIEGAKKTKPDQHFQPSSILLDVTGLSHLFNGYQSLAAQISQHCQDHDYFARLAIADSLGLAWGVAHFSHDCRFDQPQIVPPADPYAPSQLPVAGLRIDAPTCQTLQRLGIETVGQLLAIDRGDLRSRLGDHLLRRIDQLIGTIQEPIIVCKPPPEFTAHQDLPHPTGHHQTIEVVINRLIAQLCSELKSRQLGSLQWKVRMRSPVDRVFNQRADLNPPPQPGTELQFRVSLFQATATAAHVTPLAAMQLEQSLSRRSDHELNINQIIVEVSSCVLLVQQQRQLFDENPRLDRQTLAHLINRLTSRLGNDNVVYPTFRSGAQPELSFQFRPLVDLYRKRQKSKTVRTSHVLGRPLRLLTPPIAVSVQRDDTDQREIAFRKPVRIAFDNGVNSTPQPIVRSWGPERIETGWWRGVTVQRDYWRVVTESGNQFWVFCDLKQRQWFVHGEF